MRDLEVPELRAEELAMQTVTELPDRQALSLIIPSTPVCRGLAVLDVPAGTVEQPEDGSVTLVESSSNDGTTADHGPAVAATGEEHAAPVARARPGEDDMPRRHAVWPCTPVYARPYDGPGGQARA
jgi:hypothetical protein